MRLELNLIFLSLIALATLTFAEAVTKKKDASLAERIEQLTELSSRRSIIRLNVNKFKTYVGSKSLPRNYSVVVMMTALAAQRQCQVCRQAHDEYLIVANSWRYSSDFSNKLFFAMVDYDEGSDIFNMLSISSAPVFLFFSEKGKLKNADQLDIQRVGFAAETIGKWIGDRSDVNIRIIRPPNYSGTLALAVFFILVASLLYIKRNNLDFLANRTFWGLAAVSIVLAMTSGQMWNHIRGPPLVYRSARGTSYIHGSSSAQFVLETYIIIFLNASVAFGFIQMTNGMKSKGASKKAKVMVIIGTVMIAIFFSSLLSIFRSKAHGYPYSFLFK